MVLCQAFLSLLPLPLPLLTSPLPLLSRSPLGRPDTQVIKIIEKIIRENAFENKKKKPGLSANRPSNKWAQGFSVFEPFLMIACTIN